MFASCVAFSEYRGGVEAGGCNRGGKRGDLEEGIIKAEAVENGKAQNQSRSA